MSIGAEDGLTNVSGTISTEIFSTLLPQTQSLKLKVHKKKMYHTQASCASYHQFRLSSLFCSFILQTKGIKDIFQVNTFEIAIFVFDYHNYLFPTLLLNVLVTMVPEQLVIIKRMCVVQISSNLQFFTKAELCKNSAVLRSFITFLKYAAYLTFHSLWIVCKSNLNP